MGSLPSGLGKYAYFTVYDRYGRVVKQSDPGGGCQQTLYDRRDRAVLSRRASMQGDSTWFFTHYDELDRPVRTGVYRGGSTSEHLAALDRVTAGYPALQSPTDVLTEYLYDDYSWQPDAETVFSSYPYSRRINTGGRAEVREARTHLRAYVRGLETGRRVKVIGGKANDYLLTMTFYDAMSRVIQTSSDQYPLSVGSENVVNRLDAVGNVTGVYVAQRGGGRFYHAGYIKEMTYDKRDRLKEVSFLSIFDRLGSKVILPGAVISGADSRNGKVTVAAYTYDELGRVKSKSIHNGLETTSYTYDLTHCLSVTSPSFSYTLNYDGLDGIFGGPRYDGLLSENRWQHGTDPSRGYVYSYDGQGQMTSARYIAQQSDGGWEMSRNYSESVQYDTGGRITQTNRVDDMGRSHSLGRTYDGFRLSATATNDTFSYDADGNLIHDGIQNVDIQYNILGLPEKIVGGNHEIRYIYSAAGQKLASVVDGSFTYYRNTLVYEDDSVLPTKMFHPEGFVALNVMQGEFQYKYFKCDHLGSVRALLAETDGELIEEQQTDYYPFGAVHGQYENLHLNRYLFSGKELQDATVGTSGLLGWYDFGARHYNPELGHWITPDPARQVPNPYLFCGNAPTVFVDRNGMFYTYDNDDKYPDEKEEDESWQKVYQWLLGESDFGLETYKNNIISSWNKKKGDEGLGLPKNWQDLSTQDKIQIILSVLYESKQQGLDVVNLFESIPGMTSGQSQGYGFGHDYRDSQGRYYMINLGGETIKVTLMNIGGYRSTSLNMSTTYMEMQQVITLGQPKTNFKFWNTPQDFYNGGQNAMLIQVLRSSESTFMKIFR